MSAEGKSKGKTSILAFLFLPQFSQSLRSMDHVVPIFMRTVGGVLAQARLIPADHPVMRYGYEGVPRVGMGALLTQAWGNLRASKANPYQWGMYLAVVLVCFTLTAGVAHAVVMGAFGLGNIAKAQIFTLSGDTDASTMPPGPGATVPFDLTVPAPGVDGHSDYGIMLLDKVIRQGTHHVGGYLQNGMQAMMAVYNTGILAIAGVILFWLILSIVVDTAKTGVIGGQGHNMVWAPIRIVFALGILMPLSTGDCTAQGAVCGFSSGQLMVQKIAEWGSNFGSNTWHAYLKGAATDALSVPVNIDNATPLIQKYSEMWLCRVFYNTYTWQATDGESGDPLDPNVQTVVRVRHEGREGVPTWSYTFTNQDTANLCGTVELPFPAGDPAALAAFNPPNPNATPWQSAQQTFKNTVIGISGTGDTPSWEGLFNDSNNSGPGQSGTPLFWDVMARGWACDYAMHFLTSSQPGPGDIANSPLVLSNNCTKDIPEGNSTILGVPLGTCTPGGPGGPSVNDTISPMPDGVIGSPTNCVESMAQEYASQINTAISTAQQDLLNAFNAHINNDDRGWADMGSWYIDLGQLNATLLWAKSLKAKIIPGSLVYTAMAREEKSTNQQTSELDQYMMGVMHHAADWWQQESVLAGSVNAPVVPVNGCGSPGTPSCPSGYVSQPSSALRVSPATLAGGSTELGLQKTALGFLSPSSDPARMFVQGVIDFTSNSAPVWILNVLQPGVGNLYPYSQLIQIGHSILNMGVAMAAAGALIPFSLGTLGHIFGMAGVTALVGGPIGTILSAVSSSFILAGLYLSFWIPILPFIRVSFAALTWIVSVFEAVLMVPLAALGHLSTHGDGLAGNARHAWILWLNVLLRPTLTVLGFVAGIMVFNGFIVYFNRAFADGVLTLFGPSEGMMTLLTWLVVTIVYVASMHTAANASFRLVEGIPHAFFKWMPGAQPDQSYHDHEAAIAQMVTRASQATQGITDSLAGAGRHGGEAMGGWLKGRRGAGSGFQKGG